MSALGFAVIECALNAHPHANVNSPNGATNHPTNEILLLYHKNMYLALKRHLQN